MTPGRRRQIRDVLHSATQLPAGTGPHFSICTALATQRWEKKCKNCWPVTSKLRLPMLAQLTPKSRIPADSTALPEGIKLGFGETPHYNRVESAC